MSTLQSVADRYEPKDEFFGKPVFDKDELRTDPYRHRYLHGGFSGTDTRFAFYFPDKENYRGRFIQPLVGGLGGDEHSIAQPLGESMGGLGFAQRLGAFILESNQGHIGPATTDPRAGADPSLYGFRASAESARFARYIAAEVYGEPPRYGYVFGGSGGARRSVLCIENVDDVWDGAMPFMGGGPITARETYDPKKPPHFVGQGFSAMFNVQRLLGPAKLEALVDATDPGGSGDPFAGLDANQREALADLYRLGYPRGDEYMIAHPMGQIYLWGWSAETLKAHDPGYWTDFWTVQGYGGKDTPHLFEKDLISARLKVSAVITGRDLANAGAPTARAFAPDYNVGIMFDPMPAGYVLGSSLRFLSGAAKGRQLWCTGAEEGLIRAEGIGESGDKRFAGVQIGDEVEVDNRDFLAFCHWYRHNAEPPGPDRFAVDGHAIFPQRTQRAPLEPQMGPCFTGHIAPGKKMLFVQHTHDSSLWPAMALRHQAGVAAAGSSDRFRLRWFQHAEHVPPAFLPSVGLSTKTRFIHYGGAIEQSLHDLIAWVEQGIEPATDRFEYTADAELRLPQSAQERGGIQPVVTAFANGAAEAHIHAGDSLELRVEAETPPNAGTIVSVAWDVDGKGRFPLVHAEVDGSKAKVSLQRTQRFEAPGVYFPAVKVVAHREGDVADPGRRVENLGRVRITVT